jgi:hypothetical protein
VWTFGPLHSILHTYRHSYIDTFAQTQTHTPTHTHTYHCVGIVGKQGVLCHTIHDLIRGRIDTLHLVVDHAFIGEGVFLVLQLQVPSFLWGCMCVCGCVSLGMKEERKGVRMVC